MPVAVEDALRSLGYGEPDLDGDLPVDPGERVDQLLTVLLAVTEAYLRERDCSLGELYFAVCDHLAENGCACAFGAVSVPAPRRPRDDRTIGAGPAAHGVGSV